MRPAECGRSSTRQQRDSLIPGGFGERLGTSLAAAPHDRAQTAGCWGPPLRAPAFLRLHYREGHRPGPLGPAAVQEGARPEQTRSATEGPGPHPVRGEAGHDLIRALSRGGRAGHRQARQGPFHAPNAIRSCSIRGITQLVVNRSNHRRCVQTLTVRAATTADYECFVPEEWPCGS